MSRQMQTRVTHAQFYAVCQWLKNHADLKTPATQQGLGEQAEKALGFPVAVGTIADALKTTGLTYVPIAGAHGGPGRKGADIGVLAKAIAKLYQRLGEPVPVDVERLAE